MKLKLMQGRAWACVSTSPLDRQVDDRTSPSIASVEPADELRELAASKSLPVSELDGVLEYAEGLCSRDGKDMSDLAAMLPMGCMSRYALTLLTALRQLGC